MYQTFMLNTHLTLLKAATFVILIKILQLFEMKYIFSFPCFTNIKEEPDSTLLHQKNPFLSNQQINDILIHACS